MAAVCSFSLDGSAWAEARADGGPVRGPLAHTPGWDVYAITAGSVLGEFAADQSVLYVKRSAPLRSVRVFENWPTAEAPLANVLRPEGVRSAEVRLPVAAHGRNIFVAVRPPLSSVPQSQEEKRLPPGSSRSPVAGAPEGGVTAPSLGSSPEGRVFAPSLVKSPASYATAVPSAGGLESGAKASGVGRRKSALWSQSSILPQADVNESASAKRTVSHQVLSARQSLDVRCREAVEVAPTPQKDFPLDTLALEALALDAEQVAQEEKLSRRKTYLLENQMDQEEILRRTDAARVEVLEQRLEASIKSSNTSAEEARHLSSQVQKLQEKNAELAKQLRASERERMAGDMRIRNLEDEVARIKSQRRRLSVPPAPSPAASVEEVVRGLVSLELKALDNCTGEDRVAAKKRLLLKWHPDKNQASELATRVVQELQTRPEWSAF